MIKTIAISGLNATDNPAPGYPVAKSLKDSYNLVGLSYDANEPGNYLDNIFSKVYLMPYPALGFEELYPRLQEIKEKSGIDMVIPNLDAELPLYIRYQDEIEKLGIKTFLPSIKNFELRNKSKLALLSKELGVMHPKTKEIASIDDLIEVAKEFSFPFMIKGNYYKAYKVYNLESAIDAFYKISNEWGFPLLIQEVVKGEELNLVGLGDGTGTLLGALSIKKLTTTEIGKIWTGITIHHKKLLELAQDFVAYTKWKGPFELECMGYKDKLYIIEINPRFPAWVYFATGVGINLPKMMIATAQGEKITPRLDFAEGKMYVRYTDELITDFTEFSKLLSKKER